MESSEDREGATFQNRTKRYLTRLGAALLVITLFAAPVALGGLHTLVLAALAAGAGLAATLLCLGSDGSGFRPSATILLLACVGLTLYTAFQLVPFPMEWLRHLSPVTADVWSRSLRPLHESGPASAPLSLDPIATRIEVAKGLCLLLVFVGGLRVSASRKGAEFLSIALVVTALFLAAAAALHPAFGARRVFGVYSPDFDVADRHVAPLLNPNHLAMYLNIGICLALGATLHPSRYVPRPVAGAAAIALAAIQLWVGSRGGVAAMFAGALLVVWASRRGSPTPGSRAPRAWALPLLLVGFGAAVIALSSGDAREELVNTETSKFDLARHALAASRNFVLFGAGRGAFESVFATYREGRGHVVFTHPENLPAQWLFEWGWPVGILALAATAYALRPKVLLARMPLAAGPWAALVAAAIHNLADFGSEVPGVAFALAACAAIVTSGSMSPGNSWRSRLSRWATLPRVSGATAAACALVAVGLAFTSAGLSLGEDRAAMHTAALDPASSRDDFHALARQAMLRHPAEAYLPFTGALRALRARDESVIPWIDRTLERAPVYGPAHLVLARWLSRKYPAQARLEYRLAFEQFPALRAALPEAMPLVDGYDSAMELVPGVDAVAFLETIGELTESRLPATRVRLDEQLLARDANAVAPLGRIAAGWLRDLQEGDAAPWCAVDRGSCANLALQSADRARAAKPDGHDAAILRASILVETDQAAKGVDELSDSCDALDSRTDCLLAVVTLSARAHDDLRLRHAVERVDRGGCTVDAECVKSFDLIAETELNVGNASLALAYYRRALEHAPDEVRFLRQCGSLASQIGLHAEAAEYFDRLARLQPTNPDWPKAVAQERGQISRDVTFR